MKKEYVSPEWELHLFSFESIMEQGLNVSDNESGGSDYNDEDGNEW